MIIVSQDRKSIINFGETQIVKIIKKMEKTVIWAGAFDEYGEELGVYATEKRAREVLREIIYMLQKEKDEFYYEKAKGIYRGHEKQHQDRVFQMPEK